MTAGNIDKVGNWQSGMKEKGTPWVPLRLESVIVTSPIPYEIIKSVFRRMIWQEAIW